MATDLDDRGFGRAVQTYRGWLQLSQRGLADRLNEAGVSLDASALSRLEQGKRSVRLSEALAIAEALETDISALLDISPDPRQKFTAMRRRANEAMRASAIPLSEMLEAFLESMEFADEHPEVVATLTDDEIGPPDPDNGGYQSWVLKRLERTAPFVRVGSEAEAERVEAIANAWIKNAATIGESPLDDPFDDDDDWAP